MSGELCQKHIRRLLVCDPEAVLTTICPLHWGASGKVGFACRYDFGNWLVASIAGHYVLHDVVAGTGAFDLGAFPPEISGNEEFHQMLNEGTLKALTEVRNQ